MFPDFHVCAVYAAVQPAFTLLSVTPADTRIPHYQVCGAPYFSQTCVFEFLDILFSGYFSNTCNLLLFTMGRDMLHRHIKLF